MKGIGSTISLIIISILIILYHSRTVGRYGLLAVGDFLWISCLYLIAIILALRISLIAENSFAETKNANALIPLFIEICLFLIITILLLTNYYRENSEVIILAEQRKDYERSSITLRENKTFK